MQFLLWFYLLRSITPLRESPGILLLRYTTCPLWPRFVAWRLSPDLRESQQDVNPTSIPPCGASSRVPTLPQQTRSGKTYRLHAPIRIGGSILPATISCQNFLALGSTMHPCCGVHIARGSTSVREPRSWEISAVGWSIVDI